MTDQGRSSEPRFGHAVWHHNRFRPLSANERELLGTVRRDAPVSRAELARRSGLALPTVSRLVDQMMRDGLLIAEDKVMMSRTGQPSLPLSLAPHAAYAFGVAVRADMMTVDLVHLSGSVVASLAAPTVGASRTDVVESIASLIDRLVEAGDVPPDRICGLGLALPGFFIRDPERINAPLGMEDWAVADLKHDLERSLGLEVILDNDGNAAALGEYLYGHGTDYSDFAYLYVDAGLGGGLVQNGRLVRGARGNAGEFTGLLPPAMRPDRPTLTSLRSMLAHDGLTYDSLAEMLDEMDLNAAAIERWLNRSVPATEAIISAIGAIADPDAIVIGGRLPAALGDRLAERLTYYSVPVRGRDRAFPTLVASRVNGDAAALGASALCFNLSLL
ncbi:MULTISPECIES: ROK family transcriptional regulator [unclassified Sphingomonas]|uniref:ROK family transcriptional regulator n=1 Tax=unclassified Sphingomonas TaxID=196159 RepID=UPI0006F34641|nr:MULTISPECIES: ROK family transcriptional regulator [unclassified Sphingomonas]KQM28119.1 hypothetical protein ASE58_07400 [Sphingomonas sp. Leaf9]KQM44461.1 hypothetical protein ASE57_07395 [Sphingomonas sp. Leaf11]